MSYKTFLFLCTYCFLSTLPLHGETFRALVVADTASNLSESVKKDLSGIKEALHKVCKKTNHDLSLDVLDGYMVSESNIYSLLQPPVDTKTDVLLFYYTGHGFNSPKINSPWPAMSPSLSYGALNPVHVCQLLESFGARLTIILFDCCNSTISFNISLKQLEKSRPRNIRNLFLENSGTIIASASIRGYPGYAFPGGSLFTTKFIKNLFQKNGQENDTWESVFAAITTQCAPYQTPYIALYLGQPLTPGSASTKGAW